jgi:hypothetical protein
MSYDEQFACHPRDAPAAQINRSWCLSHERHSFFRKSVTAWSERRRSRLSKGPLGSPERSTEVAEMTIEYDSEISTKGDECTEIGRAHV